MVVTAGTVKGLRHEDRRDRFDPVGVSLDEILLVERATFVVDVVHSAEA